MVRTVFPCHSVHGTVIHNVPHLVMGYTQTSSRVDIGQIDGKFLAQSSIGRAGRIGWHIALILRHGGGGDSQSPDTRRGIMRAGAQPGCEGVGPGRGPGSSVDNGYRARCRRDGSGPKAPPGPSSTDIAGQRR